MTPASKIAFPFERGKYYLLAEGKAFEKKLSLLRKNNSDLSDELRAPRTGSPAWIKLRNEELIPTYYYAEHKDLSSVAKFAIAANGSETDIRLSDLEVLENLQITLAYPKWNFSERGSIKHSGKHHRALMEILNGDGMVGSGPIVKNYRGASQIAHCMIGEEVDQAFYNGLIEAIERKLRKPYVSDCTLLVYAKTYYEGLGSDRFKRLAARAIEEVAMKLWPASPIKRICIVDYGSGCFVESPNERTG